ncbi:MAG: MATE family efflux transporter [Lachnospiraceae bacterium]|nr:MATE family efflux transporter [Lachnospiraceae bacterium]MDD3615370.1 MATE family efflux transporter [Lachnospiraceae bacterium]
MEQTVHQENKMGTMPIPKLLFTMALPMIISMMIQALYNIVDSMFVAQINENALSAVSLAFPVQNLMISIVSGTCVGINALLSRNLGEHDYKGANRVAHNALLLALISYIIFAVITVSLTDVFFKIQTSDAEICAFGHDYMTLVCGLSFGAFFVITLERLLQSTGRTHLSMISQAVGAIFNIIFDPILIFGLLGFPKLGVAGAAIATVSGQILGAFISLFLNLRYNKELQFSWKAMRLHWHTIKQIYVVGIPSIIMMSIGSVMTFCFNKILLAFTSTATAVFGVYFKLNSIFFMPVFGLNSGMVPIIAFNYGARNPKRIMETYKLSAIAATCMMLIGISMFMFLPDKLLGLFNASANMLEIGVPALRIISISFLFAGYCIITGSVYQALGNGTYSLIVSLARQLFVLVPVAYFLSHAFGLQAIWWSFPIAEIISVIASFYLFKRIYRLKIKPLEA